MENEFLDAETLQKIKEHEKVNPQAQIGTEVKVVDEVASLIELCMTLHPTSDFVKSVKTQYEQRGRLSDKQLAVLDRLSTQKPMSKGFSNKTEVGNGKVAEVGKVAASSGKWCMYELSEEDIRNVAKENDCNLEGKDLDNIARSVKKGIAWAVDDVWEQIIVQAIKTTDIKGDEIKL